MSQKLFSNVLVIGLGLIGGSFAKLLKKHNIAEIIYGFDPNLTNANSINYKTAIDKVFFKEDFNIEFSLIVIATPLQSYKDSFALIDKLFLTKNPIIIDLGSLKSFVEKLVPFELRENFIGCHPICGSQKSGFENSDEKIFENKNFIICKKPNHPKNITEKLEKLITRIGCNSLYLDSKKHDEIFALTSHLPQFLSFLTKETSPSNFESDFFQNAFRLDNSNPEIWEDIFKLNERNLEKFYLDFFEKLEINIEKLSQNKLNIDDFIVSDNSPVLEEIFIKNNFAKIFFRILVVQSYLEVFSKTKFQQYIGSGFTDFTSIMSVMNNDKNEIKTLIDKNRDKILKFFDQISL